MEHFYKSGDQAGDHSALPAQAVLDQASDQAPELADPGLAYIFDHTRGKKCLVFTNSREECEAVCQVLRQYCEYKHEPDRFMIHHGNLSAALRQGAEAIMKDKDSNITTCVVLLELGVDVDHDLGGPFKVRRPLPLIFAARWADWPGGQSDMKCGLSCAKNGLKPGVCQFCFLGHARCLKLFCIYTQNY